MTRYEKISQIRENSRRAVIDRYNVALAASTGEENKPFFLENVEMGVTGVILFNFFGGWTHDETGRGKIDNLAREHIKQYGCTDIIFEIKLHGNKDGGELRFFRADGWIIWQGCRIHIYYDGQRCSSKYLRPELKFENMIKDIFRAVDDCRFSLKMSELANHLKGGGFGRIWNLEFLK